MRTARRNSNIRPARRVRIDFLYLDLTVCPRCRGTDKNLRVALKVLEPVLKAMGVRAQVHKTQVKSARQARALGFVSSPTIRVNGRDIAGELRESWCGSCSGACEDGKPVNCRVWSYHRKRNTQAPVGLIVESVLQQAIGTTKGQNGLHTRGRSVSANLNRYFAAKAPPCGCSNSATTE